MHRLILIATLGLATAASAQISSPPTPEAYVSRFGSRAKIVPPSEMTIDGKPEVCAFISKGRASTVHLSGPARCTARRACFKEPAAKGKPDAKR
jgi:hypothetical protein